jgi:hypothetical protein
MTLAWTLLFLPLAIAAANQLLLKRTGLAPIVSVASSVATFIIALLLLGKEGSQTIPWATIGDFSLQIGVKLDKLSTGMMVVVTGIGMLVHIFSLAYMADDDAKARYFTGLSVFMFSMTGIVLSSNFIMTFMFWELVGFSSYLLIGHWYKKPSAADAAKKAFITNRIGDFGFMVGNQRRPALRHLPLHLLRRGRQVRTTPAPRLAAGRHGRPHPGLRADPCRHHGRRRCLYALPCASFSGPRPRISPLAHIQSCHRLDRRADVPRRRADGHPAG